MPSEPFLGGISIAFHPTVPDPDKLVTAEKNHVVDDNQKQLEMGLQDIHKVALPSRLNPSLTLRHPPQSHFPALCLALPLPHPHPIPELSALVLETP